jgi:hypothetical protein
MYASIHVLRITNISKWVQYASIQPSYVSIHRSYTNENSWHGSIHGNMHRYILSATWIKCIFLSLMDRHISHFITSCHKTSSQPSPLLPKPAANPNFLPPHSLQNPKFSPPSFKPLSPCLLFLLRLASEILIEMTRSHVVAIIHIEPSPFHLITFHCILL